MYTERTQGTKDAHIMSQTISPAQHANPDAYWSGGEYELNLSFGTLRDRQWQRLMEAVWQQLDGPFAGRFVPGEPAPPAPVTVPAPTDAQIQFGGFQVAGLSVGCRVLATRSLFECVTIQVPLGMFAGLETDEDELAALRIPELDRYYADLALTLYEAVPFDLANMGLQCECRLVAELQVDTRQWLSLMRTGNFFVRDEVLRQLGSWPDDFKPAYPGLRWIPPA